MAIYDLAIRSLQQLKQFLLPFAPNLLTYLTFHQPMSNILWKLLLQLNTVLS